MSTEGLLKEVRGFAEKAVGADVVDKYKPAVEKGLDALDSAKNLLEKVQAGDKEGIEIALTEWEDVNRTLMAVRDMDVAIEDAENGVELMEVLAVVGKAIKIGLTLAALA